MSADLCKTGRRFFFAGICGTIKCVKRRYPAMIRLAEQQDLDRIMEIWLEGNLQAHDFVDPAY